MLKKLILIIISLGLLTTWVNAQDLVISAQVNPKQAMVGQQLRLIVTIEGKANVRGNPELPDLSAFQVYGGGRSSNFSFVNGQLSSALSFTYVLVPQKTGQFTIGPIKIRHENKVYATKAMSVTISGSKQGQAQSSVPGQQQTGPARQHTAPGTVAKTNEPVFITTAVNKKSVYVNEPVTLTFKFYRRVPLLSQPQYIAPSTNGFWTEDLPPQKTYVTNLNGHDYEVTEINTALFPTAAGKLTISPAKLIVSVRGQTRSSVDPFGDDFFSGFFARGQQVELKSKPLTINVKSVPIKDRPKDYTGTVGQWSMSAKLDRKSAKLGDAVTLEVRIFGEGNVKSVGKPKLPALTGFKAYETVSSSEVQKQNNRVKGVKIYRTLIRPQISGKLTIPEISYSYFNHNKGKFEQIKVPALQLDVTASQTGVTDNQVIMTSQQTVTGPGVKIIAKDIRYLKTNVTLSKSEEKWSTVIWIILFISPPIVLGLIWIWKKHQARLTNDPRYARKMMADKSAKKIFKTARTARHKKDSKLFYTSLSTALSGYLADQLGYSRSGITQRELLDQLKKRQSSSELINRLTNLFDECDFARFAPGERDPKEMENHEQEAEQLLSSLMRMLGQEKKS